VDSAEGSSRLSPVPLQQSRTAPRALSRHKNRIRWPDNTNPSHSASRRGEPGAPLVRWPDNHRHSLRDQRVRSRHIGAPSVVESPGLELVHKSYRQCVERRGSPVDKGRLLIAWASTPVRVFGGAIIKGAKPVCGDF
jgi:hypothetical protein